MIIFILGMFLAIVVVDTVVWFTMVERVNTSTDKDGERWYFYDAKTSPPRFRWYSQLVARYGELNPKSKLPKIHYVSLALGLLTGVALLLCLH